MEVTMVSFTECMQTAFGDVVIGLFIYSGLATVLIIILVAILFKVLNKDNKTESINNERKN